MSTDVERLRGNLKRVGLHAIADVFEREAQKAAKTKQSYVGFLDHLLDEELARKADRSVNARIIRGRFPTVKTLEREFRVAPEHGRRDLERGLRVRAGVVGTFECALACRWWGNEIPAQIVIVMRYVSGS